MEQSLATVQWGCTLLKTHFHSHQQSGRHNDIIVHVCICGLTVFGAVVTRDTLRGSNRSVSQGLFFPSFIHSFLSCFHPHRDTLPFLCHSENKSRLQNSKSPSDTVLNLWFWFLFSFSLKTSVPSPPPPTQNTLTYTHLLLHVQCVTRTEWIVHIIRGSR